MTCDVTDVQLMEKERLVSSLRGRTDSESSSAERLQTDVTSPGHERTVQDFTQQAPLIESLQRELTSAQVPRHSSPPLSHIVISD